VKNTGSTGTRQKEGQYINKSLLTLGHVVWKLAELSGKKTDGDGNVLDTTHIPLLCSAECKSRIRVETRERVVWDRLSSWVLGRGQLEVEE